MIFRFTDPKHKETYYFFVPGCFKGLGARGDLRVVGPLRRRHDELHHRVARTLARRRARIYCGSGTIM